MSKYMIKSLRHFFGKKIYYIHEWWVEETKSIELRIVFEDDTEWIITPYVDKNANFNVNKNDLRLKYDIKYSVAQLRKIKLEKILKDT